MTYAPALLALGILLAAQPAPKPGKPASARSLDDGGPAEYIAVATSLTLQMDLDDAQRVVDKGRSRFPKAHGFHLKQGNIHLARGKAAEAFYEYQYELMRAGFHESGPAAGRAIAAMIKSNARGPEYDEIQRCILAMAKLRVDGKAAHADFKSIEDARGVRYVLSVFIAEAHVQMRNYDVAARVYRSLIARDPYFVPAYVELAGVLRLQGKKKEAADLDAKARAIDASHPSLQPARP